ncbi:MAG: CD225/dispanin family protein [Fimbriimonadaceae bacterium]
MRYYVIAPDGSRYGPADTDQLKYWVKEGRVLEHTMLQEEGGTTQFPAGTVLGFFDKTQTAPPPKYNEPAGYYRAPTSLPPLETTGTIVKAVLVMCFCCQPFGIVALVFAIIASSNANTNREQAIGNLKTSDTWSNWAIGLGLGIGLLYLIFMFGLGATSMRPR